MININVKYLLSILAIVILTNQVGAQNNAFTIEILDGSFEDGIEGMGANIPFWFSCNTGKIQIDRASPDLHCDTTSFFGVKGLAAKGYKFVGLVVRDDGTCEGIGQHLLNYLSPDTTYTMTIALARSDNYYSVNRVAKREIHFNRPAKLQVWGGTDFCDYSELLGETELVMDTEWKNYKFKFQPNAEYDFITLQAKYHEPALIPYNGNILIDDVSNISLEQH